MEKKYTVIAFTILFFHVKEKIQSLEFGTTLNFFFPRKKINSILLHKDRTTVLAHDLHLLFYIHSISHFAYNLAMWDILHYWLITHDEPIPAHY